MQRFSYSLQSMPLIRISKPWQVAEGFATAERAYWGRRQFLRTLSGAALGAAGASLLGACGGRQSAADKAFEESVSGSDFAALKTNPAFSQVDRPITTQAVASRYNNFYEYGSTKKIWLRAQRLPLENWQVEVTGLVAKPQTFDLDDLQRRFGAEERVYRFRCVEAWSMVLPWVGFPMRKLVAAVEPTAAAKFVSFESFYDPDITTGPQMHFGALPWPYRESLRLDEMTNDLAFFATGIYGRRLPKQHGAPIRAVIPWKYGFKGAKSIVKIEFVAEQPPTYWNTLIPNEYGFIANVDPAVPHPRWSQATERFIGDVPQLAWEMRETLPYNGYGEYVAQLYDRGTRS